MSQLTGTREDRPKLIVTGVEGTWGANVALALSERFAVLGLYHRRTVSLYGCRTAPWRPDDQADWAGTIRQESPCWIVHCGPLARSSWDLVPGVPDGTCEGRLWAALARLAARLGTRLTVLTTDAVFAGPQIFHAENSPAAGRCPLGRAAREAERHLRRLPQVLLVRTHAYGWSPPGEKAGLVERIWTSLVGGGRQSLDADRYATPILAADLAGLLADAFDRRTTGVCHIAGAERVAQHQFARQLARAFGLPDDFPAAAVAGRSAEAGAADETSLATGLARQSLCRPMPTLREGLDRLVGQVHGGYRSRLRAGGPVHPLERAA
jgi:dTDP-4-dehydrorhamnose reductase